MSDAIDDFEDDIETKAPDQTVNGRDEQVSDEDIRALLAASKREKATLSAQLEQERTLRGRAETQAHNAHVSRFDAEEAAVKSRIDAADATALGLRRKYAEALAEGRFEDAAETQDEMAELRAKQGQDKQYQTWLGAEKERAAKTPVQPPAQTAVNLGDFTPGQRRWIKANPEFLTDTKLRQKTEALHSLAVAEGHEIDSPEYFEIIDQAVKGRRPPAEPADDDPPPRRRAAPVTDMAVTRRTDTAAAPTRGQPIRLTAEEREAADMTMPDLPEQGYTKDGVWMPSRYERYVINRAKMKARG